MKICPKCGKEYPNEENFCSVCSEKLIMKKEKPKEETSTQIEEKPKKEQIFKYTIIEIVVVLLIAAIVVFIVPSSCEATQAYCETEPYTATEYYAEKVPACEIYYPLL